MIDKTIREDFIGLDRKIFFNNASYGPMLKIVRQRIEEYLIEADNLKAGADDQTDIYMQQLREEGARMVGAKVEEIGFAPNASYGINLAATGLQLQPGDEVVMPDNEFPAIPYPFVTLKKIGVNVKYSPSINRNFSLEVAKKLVTTKTRVLAISFVQYFNGYKNDLKTIGEFCKERNIFFAVDSMQGLGACPVDVNECHIDLLAAGGEKWLLAPIGSGFFFLSANAKHNIEPFQTGWLGVDWGNKFTDLMHYDREPFKDARRYNLGTYPRMQIWGAAAALKYLNDLGIDNIYRHNIALIDHLLDAIAGDDFYSVLSSLDPKHRSSIISLGCPAGEKLQKYLLQEDFYLVYREGGLRVAINFYNTVEEVDTLIKCLREFKKMNA